MKFSIICPTYKRVSLLEEAIFSILQQSYEDWELIIINDCFDQKMYFDHPKVKIYNLQQKFSTLAEKRNFGLEHASGQLVIQLDDDDLFLPNYLSALKERIGDYNCLFSQRVISYSENPDKINISLQPFINTILFRRDVPGGNVRFSESQENEFIKFRRRVSSSISGKILFSQLPPSQCGYVHRKNIPGQRYIMGNLSDKSQNEREALLQSIPPGEIGNISLSPAWRKNYSKIIEEKCDYSIDFNKLRGMVMNLNSEAIEKTKKWTSVKASWENASKFIKAVGSRGVLSSAADFLNLSKSGGSRVSEEIYQKRQESCFGEVSKGISQCVNLRKLGDKGVFCGACGCGANPMARLDPENEGDYTKLHYPELECPLQKPGFSNQNLQKISVIITALNENRQTLLDTIKSIQMTSTNTEIIVVDDCSDIPVIVDDPSIKVLRNPQRVGCAPSRQRGALEAKNEYLLFTDSHMIFESGWYDEFLLQSEKHNDNVAFCGTCLGLDDEHKTLREYHGRYCGARLALYEEKENQVLEGKWISEKRGDSYEISCMMGAIYIINKEYFFKLRGLSDLKMWGSDEPCLALKILQSGGKMILLKKLRAGHFFRNNAPYLTNQSYLVYNKIRMAMTLLPDEIGKKLLDRLPRDGDFFGAMNMIQNEQKEITEYREYYKSIFTEDFRDICKKYDIEIL